LKRKNPERKDPGFSFRLADDISETKIDAYRAQNAGHCAKNAFDEQTPIPHAVRLLPC
jgi:hypothetical protein